MIHLPRQWRARLLATFILVPVAGAQDAGQEGQARSELGKIKQRIQEIEDALVRARQGRKNAFDELAEIESSLAGIARNRRRLEQAEKELRERRLDLEGEQLSIERDMQTKREGLYRSLRMAFAIGRQDTVKLILNGERAGDIPRLLRYHEFMSRKQRTSIQELDAAVQRLSQVRSKLDEQAARLAALSREQAAELQAGKDERERREQILARIDIELGDAGQQLERLKRDRAGLETLLEELEHALSDIPREQELPRSFAALRGKLPWPIRGRQIHRYASARASSGLKWQGVVLAAPLGSEVRAVANGQVVYASEVRGFGNVIIVDHGAGFMSLYGHTETPVREPGEWVNAGDVVATVGDSGGARRSGLYFEIRHKGEPRNPNRWCSARARFPTTL